MSHRTALLRTTLTTLLIAGASAGCIEELDLTETTAPVSVSVSVLPQLSAELANTPASRRISAVELIVRDRGTGVVLADGIVDRSPDASNTALELRMQVEEGAGIEIEGTVRLFGESGDVEWSGVFGPTAVTAAQAVWEIPVAMGRGDLANLSIESLTLSLAAALAEQSGSGSVGPLAAEVALTEGGEARVSAAAPGGPPNPRIFWSTDTPDIVQIDAEGRITAILPGTGTIRATAGMHVATLTVMVTQRIEEIEISPDLVLLTALGEEVEFEVLVLDPRGVEVPGAEVSWAGGGSVLTALAPGRYRASAPGTAEVTATAGGISATARVEVTQQIDRVEVTPAAWEAESIGAMNSFVARVLDRNGFEIPGAPVVWNSSDPSIVSVDATGTATAQGVGSARITATAGDASAGADVTVRQVVTEVRVTPDEATVFPGETFTFSASLVDQNGNPVAGGEAFVWGSEDTGIATVDRFGNATALQVGTTTIVARSGAVQGSARFIVEPIPLPPRPEGNTKVGYFRTSNGAGATSQVAPIETGRGIPVNLTSLSAEALEPVSVLFIDNPSNSGMSSSYLNHLAALDEWVQAGGTLILHDRHVTTASSYLPGGSGITIVRDLGSNIDILDNTTHLTNGPGGEVTNTNLDGGNFSLHGWAQISTLPEGAVALLSPGNAGRAVTFSYPHGHGFVIYSTIPLDFYLNGSSPAAFRQIYAPNVVAYGLFLRLGFLPPPVEGLAAPSQVTSPEDAIGGNPGRSSADPLSEGH